MKEKRGFTLVELLAVIVILAVILIIAMPKISDVIKNSKEASLETTAKLIASQAEKKYTENQVLDGSSTIKCSDVAKISLNDYESCNITFDDKGNAKVSIVGKGKFEGMAVCNASKNSACITSDCSTEAKYFSYVDIPVVSNVIVEDTAKCTSYIQSKFKLTEEQVTTLCTTDQAVNGSSLQDTVSLNLIQSSDYETAGLKVETIDGISITGFEIGTIGNVEVVDENKCKNYVQTNFSYDEEQSNNYCSRGEVDGYTIQKDVISGDIPSSDYENAGLKITYENGGGTDAVIPSQIDGKAVVAIGDKAFYDSNTGDGLGITSVVMPSTLTSIGENSFYGNKLTNVEIPSSITKIGDYAFSGNQLTSVTIPNSVISIGAYAFRNNQITSITFPDTPIMLGCDAFRDNPIINDDSYSFPNNVIGESC